MTTLREEGIANYSSAVIALDTELGSGEAL
jgi:hypothetical protein